MISIIVISKDEWALRITLSDLANLASEVPVEVVVVDASSGRLDAIRREFPKVRWIDFEPPGSTVTIPHQRNRGMLATAASDIIVFTDAGCRLDPDWLELLTAPITSGSEEVTAGLIGGSGAWSSLYDRDRTDRPTYLEEAPTGNLAMSRRIVDLVGKFDETFEYGSDIDYSWRIVESGARIRFVPEAVVVHDWGGPRRQLRRSYRYGQARARLHRKHRTPLTELVRRDPVLVAYPAFLLGLPLTLIFPAYPLLLVIPAWRARRARPGVVVVDHLVFGAGALVELLR